MGAIPEKEQVMKRTSTDYYEISNAELEQLITDAGFTSAFEVSEFFGLPDRLVRDWFDGTKGVPIPAVMVLKLMIHHNDTPTEVLSITELEVEQ
jgi:hypothetical protein